MSDQLPPPAGRHDWRIQPANVGLSVSLAELQQNSAALSPGSFAAAAAAPARPTVCLAGQTGSLPSVAFRKCWTVWCVRKLASREVVKLHTHVVHMAFWHKGALEELL